MMVQAQEEIGEGTDIPTDPQHIPTIIQPSTSQPSRKQKFRKTKRKDTQVPQLSVPTESVADEAVNKQMDDRLTTPNESSYQGTDSGGGLMRQDTMGDAVAQTRSDRVSKISNEPLLARVNIPQSVEDILKLNELMDLCTNLQNMVLALEATKTTQAHEIDTRVESFDDEGLGWEDASKLESIIDDLDADEDITHVNDQEMFDADKDIQVEEVGVKQEVIADKEPIIDVAHVSAVATTITINDITLAKAIEEPMKLKKKDQILFDEEVARNLQEEINEEERLIEERELDKRYKFNSLKNKSFADIQDLSVKAMKRANTFVDYTTELVEESSKKVEAEIIQEESSKRAGDELEQETAKKQKIVDDKETTNLKQLEKIIPAEDITIDAIPLAVKTLIVD
uniref:Uncharacterized protein n=1 Tax=Tanacetum cinerariifolium TaxID=118510 RepID=A0A699GFU0_TANCI|nr:hypothetical protein [Tanacetum cinerariifolium]